MELTAMSAAQANRIKLLYNALDDHDRIYMPRCFLSGASVSLNLDYSRIVEAVYILLCQKY